MRPDTFYEAALQTIDRTMKDKQELLSALETAYEILQSVGVETPDMDYIHDVLIQHDGGC